VDQQACGWMLKKPASFVLASLRGSTYQSLRLVSSLAAALLDSLFEHPARLSLSVPAMQVIEALLFRNGFFLVC
jgi:hypothetical protein